MSQLHPVSPPPGQGLYYDEARHTLRVGNYELARAALEDQRLTQDVRKVFQPTAGPVGYHPAFDAMWGRDGVEHRIQRALVREPFSYGMLNRLQPQIRALADSLLATALADHPGQIEIMRDFARPLSSGTTCELLQVDLSLAPQFAAWMDEFAAAPSFDKLPEQDDMVAFLRQLLQERRQRPGDGIVDHLIAAKDKHQQRADQQLTEEDLLGYLFSLLFAGTETTATGLGDALLTFVENNVFNELAAERALLGGAIEESLRRRPSFPTIPLWAMVDMRIGEYDISAGQAVEILLDEANRNPEEFLDPDTFKLGRSPNRHLSFGWGRHLCLGVNLGRYILQVGVGAVLDTIPLPIELDPERPAVHRPGFVNSLIEAHFIFSPGRIPVDAT